jgi:hypothetical protein
MWLADLFQVDSATVATATAKTLADIAGIELDGARRARARSSRAERLAVYRQFQVAVVDFIFVQQSVRSMVPSLVGAFWSYPVHHRRLRRMDETAARLLQAVTDLRLIGNPEPCAKAWQVTRIIPELGTHPAPKKSKEVQAVIASMAPVVESIGKALADFTEAARVDLGHEKRQWWRRGRHRGARNQLELAPSRSTPAVASAEAPAAIASSAALTRSSEPGSK